MRRDLHELEGLGKSRYEGKEATPYMLLQLRAVSSRSRVVQSPLSIFSIKDAKLLNLHAEPGREGSTGTADVRLVMSTHSALVESDRAKPAKLNPGQQFLKELSEKERHKEALPGQEGLCLLSAEGRRDQLLSEGCGFRLCWGKRALDDRNSEPLSYYHWGEGGDPLPDSKQARAGASSGALLNAVVSSPADVLEFQVVVPTSSP